MELQEHTHTHTHTNTHIYIQIAIQNGIRSANLPGSSGLIAQLILIFSHLPAHTYTHQHTRANTHTHTHTHLRSLSPPLAVRQCACFIAVWNCFGMSLMVGRGQPQMFGRGRCMWVCVYCRCAHIWVCARLCSWLNVCSLMSACDCVPLLG